VGERVRRHVTTALPLQAVVADGRRRSESFFHVALLDDVLRRVRAGGPHAGEAVGLQLQAHRQRVGRRFVE
jgi:hypothetical protein